MHYLINPIWFYFTSVCSNIGAAGTLLGSVGLVIVLIGVFIVGLYNDFDFKEKVTIQERIPNKNGWHDYIEKEIDNPAIIYLKKLKKWFIACLILLLVSCCLPSEKTCYEMMLASLVTQENYEATKGEISELGNYIIDAADKIIDEQNTDTK